MIDTVAVSTKLLLDLGKSARSRNESFGAPMRNTYSATVSLDASGFAGDQFRTYAIPSPVARAVIDGNTVQLTPHVLRGNADVRDVVVNEFSVGFTLWAQAAGGGIFGHHSGSISVDVAFQYFDTANLMSADELRRQKWSAKRASNIVARGSIMAGIKPAKITFLGDNDKVTGDPLTTSHFSSLDDAHYFTNGNPRVALIVGPVNAQIFFFDDQEFKFDQNVLFVSLKVEGTEAQPVPVYVAEQRLGPGDHDNGIYKGENDTIGWILYKTTKASWVQNTLRIAGDFVSVAESVAAQVPGGAGQWVNFAASVVQQLTGFDTPGRSDNSQVDNISSVLFGAAEG